MEQLIQEVVSRRKSARGDGMREVMVTYVIENSWILDEIVLKWLQKMFLSLTQPEDVKKRRLLVFDSYRSY